MSNLSPVHNRSFEAGWHDGYCDRKLVDQFNEYYMQGWKVGKDDRQNEEERERNHE